MTYPFTVAINPTTVSIPLGDVPTALSYVSFSTNTLTFTAPGQTQSFVVTLSFPATALTPLQPTGAYTYKVTCTGWPVGFTDPGFSLSAAVSLPGSPPIGNPPTVTITTPADGSPFTFDVSAGSLTVPFSFTATTDSTSPVITGLSASFGLSGGTMSSVALVTTQNSTTSFTGTGNFTVTAPGTYLLQATATNGASTTDTDTYTVTVTGPPPTITIQSPTPNASFDYLQGHGDTVVACSFKADTTFGAIQTLTAQVDQSDVTLTPSGLGSAEATATINLPYNAGGSHTLTINATNNYTSATQSTTFFINFIPPNPAVTIAQPTPNQTFTIPAGNTTVSVPYSFTTTVGAGFVVDTVSANLGNTVLTPVTTGLNTAASATSTGTISLPAGSYTLVATGGSVGSSASASVSFVVKAALVPPSVVINSPSVGYTKAIVPGTTVTIPLSFTGTSNNPSGTISQLSATLDGYPLTVSSSTLRQLVATGTSTMSVSAAGTHHIVVTATDGAAGAGSATAAQDFTITFLSSHQISGTVFFDLNGNGVMSGPDFGLAFITIKLRDSTNAVISTTTTDAAGHYSFTGLFPGTYSVVAKTFAGLKPTTPTRQVIALGSTDVIASPIGYQLDFCAIQAMEANGNSLGFWKNNVSKTISGSKCGMQLPAATIIKYTNNIADFALSPFDGLTLKQALAIMSSNSCAPRDQLAKQLLPAEYNYQNGAYLNGNPTLTFAFVAWGEAVLQNSGSFPSAYVLWAKGWFDAYNNSNGENLDGPDPLDGSCGGSTCGGSSDGGHSHDDDEHDD